MYRIKSFSTITVRNNKQAGVSPVLISCVNDSDLQMLLGNVSTLKGRGMRICTDLPSSLPGLLNEVLAKTRDLKAQQISKFTRVKQSGARLLLQTRNDITGQWVTYDEC